MVTGGFAALAALALMVAAAAAARSATSPTGGRLGWLEAWVRFDSGWYLAIAQNGYFFTPGQQSSVAFFPTYPLLMRAGGVLTDLYLAGIGLTLAAGLASALMFTRWCQARLSRPATVTSVALLLLYPYALYLYGAVYADAVFVACALAAFLLLDRGHPVLAGLVGALATAGRPVGVAVAAGLAVRAVELAGRRAGPAEAVADPVAGGGDWAQRGRRQLKAARRSLRCVRWPDAGVLLAGTGFAGYLVYQWAAFGNPLAFVVAESAWSQGSGPRTWLKVDFFGRLLWGGPAEVARLLLPALLCLGAVLLLPRIRRRFGWGYATFTAIAVAIPIVGTKDFMGSGRYLLLAFPLFAVVGELLAERTARWVRPAVLTGSALLLLLVTVGYGYGYEVS